MVGEHPAIEAVARHFSASRETGDTPASAFLNLAGQRIALEVASIDQRIAERERRMPPRLRFDKVARRFVEGLRVALHDAVPNGSTLILTVTAPIRLAAKTAAAVKNEVLSGRMDFADTIQGNEVRARLVTGAGSRAAPCVIGFVHNRDSDPDILFEVARSLIDCIDARPPAPGDERWLAIVNEARPSDAGTYRRVCAQLAIPTELKRMLMVFAGSRVEDLLP